MVVPAGMFNSLQSGPPLDEQFILPAGGNQGGMFFTTPDGQAESTLTVRL
jgi:hypothetical protein